MPLQHACICLYVHAYGDLTCTTPPPRSISRNAIMDKGASVLAATLKETRLTHLECAALASVPTDTPIPSLSTPTMPVLCSIDDNSIGDEGAASLAAVLKETAISTLKCAPPPNSVPLLSPLTTPTLPMLHSVGDNDMGKKGISLLEKAAGGSAKITFDARDW